MNLVDLSELTSTAISFSISLIFLVVILLIVYYQRMKMERFIIISTLRGFFQLLMLASILAYVFSIENGFLIYTILTIMAWFSAQTAAKRLQIIPDLQKTLLVIQIFTIYLVMTLLILLNILPYSAAYIIPIGGMVAGNSMNISYLTLDRLTAELKNRGNEVESALALGASPAYVLKKLDFTAQAMRNSITPVTNNLRTLGIVAIPGLMSGMIIGGINPIIAAFYQVLIFFLIIFAGLISGGLSAYFSLPKIFDMQHYSLKI